MSLTLEEGLNVSHTSDWLNLEEKFLNLEEESSFGHADNCPIVKKDSIHVRLREQRRMASVECVC